MQALKADIEAFNPVEIQGQPRWLTPPKEGQATGSLVLALASEEARNRCILQGLTVANRKVIVVPYRDTSLRTLCNRCQQYGHMARGCKKTPKCRLCGKGHFTWAHKCNTCGCTGKPCDHLEKQCISCRSSGHWAGSKTCDAYKAL